MSYILDALKKKEHERARKKGSAGMSSISGELFSPETYQLEKSGIWKIVTIVIFVAVLASAVTWYLLPDGGPAKNVQTSSAELKSPIPAPPAVSSSSPQPSVSVASHIPVVGSNVQSSAAVLSKPENQRPTLENSKPPVRKEVLAVQTMAPPANIKVSGIAWQEERTARRAVVNGFLLKEGSIVSGAKIVEIQPVKVRFSMAGKIFELSMHSSGAEGIVK